MYKKIIFFICFLIISCDLPNEADVDCSGEYNGNAFIGECGICVGGNTGIDEGFSKNICGKCFGPEVGECLDCGSSDAINYNLNADEECISDCIGHDESLCVYDMCVDYLPDNLTSYECNDLVSNNVLYETLLLISYPFIL